MESQHQRTRQEKQVFRVIYPNHRQIADQIASSLAIDPFVIGLFVQSPSLIDLKTSIYDGPGKLLSMPLR